MVEKIESRLRLRGVRTFVVSGQSRPRIKRREGTVINKAIVVD